MVNANCQRRPLRLQNAAGAAEGGELRSFDIHFNERNLFSCEYAVHRIGGNAGIAFLGNAACGVSALPEGKRLGFVPDGDRIDLYIFNVLLLTKQAKLRFCDSL